MKRATLAFDPDGGKIAKLLFAATLPFLVLLMLFRLAYHKFVRKTVTVVCLAAKEKILTACPARWLGLKTVWLESPNERSALNGIASGLFIFCAKKAIVVCFNRFHRDRLCRRLAPENVRLIEPGIRPGQYKYQDNIFNNLAHLESGQKKFFTLGAIVNLDDPRNVSSFELLFSGIKKSLSAAPNLQLIIVGNGAEKKRLSWLAKKLEIESLIWFVGEQQHLKKWLDGFDLFLMITDRPKLSDLLLTLKAMAAELPVLARTDVGLDEIVQDGKTGFLVSMRDDDKITEKIISLRRDKYLVRRLGAAGRELVEKKYNIAGTVRQFEKIL